jgi:hypothetical protein
LTAVGSDFPRERFLRTPCKTIWSVLAFVDHYEQGITNSNSVTTARLADYVLQGIHVFSHNQPPKSRPQDFLPYPSWTPEGEDTDGPSESTKFVLGKLLREGQIPFHVFAALNSPSEQPG